jgi:hypothetical protein
MDNYPVNHYEKAFESWLIDNRIKFTVIDQSKRAAFGKVKLKSFDFLLYRKDEPVIIAEVKGRMFKGTTFEKLRRFECWVLADDVEGLLQWQNVFGNGHEAYFIFAYNIENIDVDFDGRGVYESAGRRYSFAAIKLDDYRRYMKLRSPKWRTVTLGADDFRKFAISLEELILKSKDSNI